MALVKYGPTIVQASGSIAGTTYARNRFGNYIRSRTKPINPKSNRQIAIRVIMMYLAEQWRESPMTDEIRLAWETYAKSFNWNNKLGEQVTLTGENVFIQCNAARITAGGDLVTAAPEALGLPPGDTTFAVTGSAASKKLTVAFDNTFDWANESGGFLAVYMGRPQSPSRNFFATPYRFAGAVVGDDTTPPESGVEIDPPFTLVATQKVWCEGRVIRMDARCSTRFGTDPFVVGT